MLFGQAQRAQSKLTMELKRAEQGNGNKEQNAVMTRNLQDAPDVIEATISYLETLMLQDDQGYMLRQIIS
ncbi:hypothetical protein N9L68_08395 [bacterium]|nr:hypothetical protein [bacterium]